MGKRKTGNVVNDASEGPRARVFRVEGEARELLGSFASKSEAVRVARDAAEKDKARYGTLTRFTYLIEVSEPVLHIKVSQNRKIIRLGHETIKQLTAAWIEATHGISKTYSERIVGKRKLDLVLENPFAKPRFRIFVEIETKPVKNDYVTKFFLFCKQQKPNKAFLVTPVLHEHTLEWVDRTLPYKAKLHIVPTKQMFEKVQELYSIKFGTLESDVILTLEPNKVLAIQTSLPD
jgi:hypothetical protein